MPENHDTPDDTADDATQVGDAIAASIPQDALMARLEALLFVHAKPVSARRLADLCGVPSVIPVKQSLGALRERYDAGGHAFTIQELAGGYQLTTRPEHDGLLNSLVREREAQKLSPAALEALAVIAYKQPIGRMELESIRGAGSDHLVRALLDRGLIAVVDRDKKPGAPALYGTTGEFLRAFGLRALSELPRQGDLAAPSDDDKAAAAGDNVEITTEEVRDPSEA